MTDRTREMLEEQVTAQAESWTAALDHATGDHEHADEPADDCEHCEAGYESPWDVLDSEALSVEYEWAGPNRADMNVTRVRIVLGTGGPHVEIVARVGQGAEIVGYWGGEKVTRYLDHPATVDLAEQLAELAEVDG